MVLFKNMKQKLMFQSMLPLFIIELILNFKFISETGVLDFVGANLCTLISEFILLILTIFLLAFYAEFRFYRTVAGDLPQKAFEVKEEKEAGLTFFLTYILSISFNELSDPRELLAFIVVMTFLFLLMSKTNLYYANPILTILGYRIYHIKSESTGDDLIVITMQTIKEGDYVSIKAVEDNVVFGIRMEG